MLMYTNLIIILDEQFNYITKQMSDVTVDMTVIPIGES